MSVTATDVQARLTEAAQGALRPATDADAVAGVAARFVVSPSTTEQICAVLALAHEAGLAVVPRGSGSKLAWGAPPERCDVVLDLTGLDRLVEHTAGDLVAIAQAGRRLDDLQRDLAEAGQRLAVDPPRGGTVGGLVASATTGPVRLFAGPVRDLVIGTTVVRADGVRAKSGGKVVKNVAGYDLGKVLTGSFGTLAVLTEVAFRLHPLAESSRWASVPVGSTTAAQDVALRVAHSQLTPSGCELDWRGGSGVLAIRMDGLVHGVEDRIAAALDRLGPGAESSASPPDWWGTEPDGGDVLLKVTHEAASLGALLDTVDRAASAAGADAHTRGSVVVGTVYVSLPATAAPAFVEQLRGAGNRFGGAVVILDAPPEVKEAVDVWGPVRGLELMRRVKEQFDPTGVLSPGRFVGGI
jgi:glycolate oxidase FAD binding subunit